MPGTHSWLKYLLLRHIDFKLFFLDILHVFLTNFFILQCRNAINSLCNSMECNFAPIPSCLSFGQSVCLSVAIKCVPQKTEERCKFGFELGHIKKTTDSIDIKVSRPKVKVIENKTCLNNNNRMSGLIVFKCGILVGSVKQINCINIEVSRFKVQVTVNVMQTI